MADTIQEWCDKARALVNINTVCGIGRSLRRFEASLPVQSENLSEALDTVDEVLNTAPEFIRDLNATILQTAGGAQNVIYTYQNLALSPLRETNQTIRDTQAQVGNIARGFIEVIDSLNCASETLSGHAIPGLSRVRSCLNNVLNTVDGILNDVQQTIGEWEGELARVMDERINDLDERLGRAIREFQEDHEIVACLSSWATIPDHVLRSVGNGVSGATQGTASAGSAAGSCSGLARSIADLYEKAKKEIDEALIKIQDLNDQAADARDAVLNIAQTTPGEAGRQLRESVSTLTNPPVPVATQNAITASSAAAAAASSSMQTVAQKSSVTQVAFTYGHEIFLDRVGDIIRIKHRDKYTMLFDNSNIIAATEVMNKRLVWLEDMMTVYNTHTHGPTPPPTPQLLPTHGTTIFKAG